MSDLIRRKKIRDYIKGEINPYGKPFEGTAYELGLKIIRYIDAMDSDYDIDNVVEELEKRKQEYLVGFGIHANNEMYIQIQELLLLRSLSYSHLIYQVIYKQFKGISSACS